MALLHGNPFLLYTDWNYIVTCNIICPLSEFCETNWDLCPGCVSWNIFMLKDKIMVLKSNIFCKTKKLVHLCWNMLKSFIFCKNWWSNLWWFSMLVKQICSFPASSLHDLLIVAHKNFVSFMTDSYYFSELCLNQSVVDNYGKIFCQLLTQRCQYAHFEKINKA